MAKRVSIRDVAKEAGVSPATVSYILNDNQNVTISDETKERVLDAVERLKYVPSQAAKTLGSSRVKGKSQSKMIGIIIPQTEDSQKEAYIMFSNPFYGTFLSAVEYETRKVGYHVLVSGTNVGQSYIEIVKSRTLDGVIVVGTYPTDDVDEYKQLGIPTVLVDCYGSTDYFFHSVRTDDRRGGYVATRYLLDKGHRGIAIVTGELKENGVNYMRYLGYQDALREAGIPFDRDFVFDGYVGFQYGVEAAETLAERNRRDNQEITAVFATSDIAAIGVIKGLGESGVSVPNDMSVIGFDDIDFAGMYFPGLTTIRQNIMEKGKEAAQIMIAAVDNQNLTKCDQIIPMELVERGTVREIKSGNQV